MSKGLPQSEAPENNRPENAKPALPGKQQRRRKVLLICACVLLCVVLALGTLVWVGLHYVGGRVDGGEELPSAIKTLPEYTGDGVNFLVCGIDYDEVDSFSTPDRIGNTDMILYCHYDTRAGKLNILQLPRDVFVGAELSTGGYGRINGLYKHAEDPANRMGALARVLYDQFKLTTDFYITIDMDAVKEILGITGGIEVYVAQEVVDKENPDNAIPSGWRHFTPDEAEFFLRNRNYSGDDNARLQMQQYFYAALFRQFKQLSPGDLMMWMQVLMYRVKTDMSDPDELWQLGGIALKAMGLESGDITFVRPSVSGATYNGQLVVSLVPEDMAEVLNTWFRFDDEPRYSAGQLDIQTLPVNEYGTVARSVRTMGDVEDSQKPR